MDCQIRSPSHNDQTTSSHYAIDSLSHPPYISLSPKSPFNPSLSSNPPPITPSRPAKPPNSLSPTVP